MCDMYTCCRASYDCPAARQDEYAERGMDVVRGCDDCSIIPSCATCLFEYSEICPVISG